MEVGDVVKVVAILMRYVPKADDNLKTIHQANLPGSVTAPRFVRETLSHTWDKEDLWKCYRTRLQLFSVFNVFAAPE